MKLYYNMIKIDGKPVLIAAEQGYYDRTGGIDDGTCPDSDAVTAAMEKAGAEFLSPSMYGTGGKGAQEILKALRADGHWLAAKPAMCARLRGLPDKK